MLYQGHRPKCNSYILCYNMRMNRLKAIAHPIETARTAPVGSSAVGLNVIPGVFGVAEAIYRSDTAELLLTLPAGAFGVAIGSLLIIRQLRLRRRIEESIDKNGFQPRVMGLTTDEWCARQTVRTALRETEYFNAYEQLCTERESTAQLKWLPHI